MQDQQRLLRKAIEFSLLNRFFCGNLEDWSVEKNADGEGLVCDISEGSKYSVGLFMWSSELTENK